MASGNPTASFSKSQSTISFHLPCVLLVIFDFYTLRFDGKNRKFAKNSAFYFLKHYFLLCVMDFEEFAEALGESQLLRYIRMCFEKHIPPDEHMHNKAGLLFREYMLVGGMPKAVSKYLESGKSFLHI